MVDVNATMDTWVAAEVGMTVGLITGGYKVLMMVPRFVMYASPGPVHCKLASFILWIDNVPDMKKKPRARDHIV
jgi:hypothetical protein